MMKRQLLLILVILAIHLAVIHQNEHRKPRIRFKLFCEHAIKPQTCFPVYMPHIVSGHIIPDLRNFGSHAFLPQPAASVLCGNIVGQHGFSR